MEDPIMFADYDCSTGQQTWREATAEESEQILANQAEYESAATAAAAQFAADIALVGAQAAADPAYAALVRIAGIRLPDPGAQEASP